MSDQPTQKLINAGADVVDEMLEGVISAHGDKLWRPEGSPRAVVARHGPRPGKVALVIGGGSGHEPTFLGFVGKGLADAAAIGNVFASPPPQPAVDAALAAHGGEGVLFMYGNYSGDVMNFDMAAELLALEGVEARTVLTTDDIASAPRAERDKRRGVAGNVFIFKAAGAAADRMMSLDEVRARRAPRQRPHLHARRRAGALLAAADAARRTSRSAAGEMEIGMGIHGEPGMRRERAAARRRRGRRDHGRHPRRNEPAKGDRVAVLVNSLGATPLMELYILNRRVAQRLADAGIVQHVTLVGPYCTSLEMAGASITLMQLDDELQALLDHPCDCAMFSAGLK